MKVVLRVALEERSWGYENVNGASCGRISTFNENWTSGWDVCLWTEGQTNTWKRESYVSAAGTPTVCTCVHGAYWSDANFRLKLKNCKMRIFQLEQSWNVHLNNLKAETFSPSTNYSIGRKYSPTFSMVDASFHYWSFFRLFFSIQVLKYEDLML